MDVKEAMLKRRSIRKYKADTVDQTIIDELLHSAMSGPSACNKMPWEFYVVTKSDVLAKLYTATRFTKISAPLAIVVCGNLTRALPLHLASFWIQDCSAATENILLRATSLGLGSLWCGVHPQERAEDKVRKILGLSKTMVPLNIIYLGYPLKEEEERDQYNEKRVHYID